MKKIFVAVPLFAIMVVMISITLVGVVLDRNSEQNPAYSNTEVHAKTIQDVNKNIVYQDNDYTVTRFYDGFNTCYIAQNNDTYDVALTCVN